jgi:hypothetical protein
MNESRTHSILQRLPVILAVTAASYGLSPPAQAHRVDRTTDLRNPASGACSAAGPARVNKDELEMHH